MTLCEDWCTVDDVIGSSGAACGPCAGVTLDETAVVTGITVASEVLYGLTWERFPGLCAQVLRPCATRPRCGPRWNPAVTPPYGRVVTSGRCSCSAAACSCSRLERVDLVVWPVNSVTEVKIDGDVIDAARYRLDGRWLVAVDPDLRWPRCQDLAAADTEPDTFSVAALVGEAPSPGGVAVAARFACQIAKALCGDETCELPDRTTSITRQGVGMTLDSVATLVAAGSTGLADVDLWILGTNGGDRRPQSPMLIASPDVPAGRVYRPGG